MCVTGMVFIPPPRVAGRVGHRQATSTQRNPNPTPATVCDAAASKDEFHLEYQVFILVIQALHQNVGISRR